MLANECHMTLSTAGEMARGLRAGSSPALPEPVRALADLEFQGNTLLAWTVALAIALGVAFALRLVQGFLVARVLRSASTTRTRLDDVFLDVVRATSPWFHLTAGMLVGQGAVELEPGAHSVLRALAAVVIGYQFGRWAQTAVVQGVSIWASTREGGQSATLAAGLRFLGRLVIWSVVVLAILSNLGIELSAIIAGLGVGGVAAALAVQSTLGDLIAGVSMYFDRPFDIGDFIIVDDFMGTVQKIGARTTRVSSLGGEEIVFPNGDLAKARIRNYARMKERRVVFGFGIEYNLPAEKIRRARDIAAEVIQAREGVRFDRAHFKAYGAYSLDYEVVYYVLSPDYNTYMDHQHAINSALYTKFEEAGVPFAFPTRTIFTKSLDDD
jgi:small-conductance mechanosensitive channel